MKDNYFESLVNSFFVVPLEGTWVERRGVVLTKQDTEVVPLAGTWVERSS